MNGWIAQKREGSSERNDDSTHSRLYQGLLCLLDPNRRNKFINNNMNTIIWSRVWDMPNSETFSIPAIGHFVKRYLMKSKCSIDPFARNKRWATHTNDLNPATAAEHHMYAEDFLKMLADKGTVADLVICDPPYSPRQVKECYDSIGIPMKQTDVLLGFTMKRLNKEINRLVPVGGIVLHFGWNTVGMGKGWVIEEIMIVCHGSDHNDTICMAERKLQSEQTDLQFTEVP